MAAKKITKETEQAALDADVFVSASRERNDADKRYQAAKASLKVWLGAQLSKTLPDGRTVSLNVVPRAGFEVQPGTTATMVVSPPPAG